MKFLRSAVLNSAALIIAIVFLPAVLLAEDPAAPSAEMLPAGAPPLPTSRERGGGLLITPDSVEQYRDLVVDPVYAWIKQRKFVFRAVRSLDQNWRLAESWEAASRRPEPRCILGSGSQPERNPAAQGSVDGLPFGTKELIAAEQDPEKKAAKILWNVIFTENMAEEFRYSLEMTWSGSQILRRRADLFLYSRFFPQLEEGQPFLSQSVLRFITPTSAMNYSLIAWSFRDDTRSRFWIFSPPIQKIRDILPANRSDGILGSSYTTDDVFVWSGDLRRFNHKVIGEKTLFVLYPSTKSYPLVPQTAEVLTPETPDGAQPPASGTPSLPSLALTGLRDKTFSGGGPAAVLWNHDAKQFPQLAPWLPVTVIAVPRKVWVIEMFPKDPFYEAGRELLYIDQEMMLPVTKVTYDRIGELQKTVVGGWGLAEKKAEKKDPATVIPFFAFGVAVEQGEASVTALTTTGLRKFSGKENAGMKLLRGMMQPETYGKPRDQDQKADAKADPKAKPDADKPAKKATPAPTPEEAAPVD